MDKATPTLRQRCDTALQSLPDAPYRAMLAALFDEMLAEVERLAAQAAPSSAIIASLCGDVEPVAYMFQHGETGRITFVDTWQKENGWAAANPRYSEVGALHGASTVAALKARVAELEKDAARYQYLRKYSYIELECDSPRSDEWRPEHLDADIDAAIAKKAKDAP